MSHIFGFLGVQPITIFLMTSARSLTRMQKNLNSLDMLNGIMGINFGTQRKGIVLFGKILCLMQNENDKKEKEPSPQKKEPSHQEKEPSPLQVPLPLRKLTRVQQLEFP